MVEVANMTKELDQLMRKEVANIKVEIVKKMVLKASVNFVACELDLDSKSIKDLAFQMKSEHAPFVGVFASKKDGKVGISVAVSDDVIADRGLKAGSVIRDLAKFIRGGGGGQPEFASAGGSYPEGIKKALSFAEGLLE